MTKVSSTLQFTSMNPITYVHILPTQIEGHCAKITGCCTSNSADSESCSGCVRSKWTKISLQNGANVRTEENETN